MPGPFRQTDSVLTISQDNVRKAIEVTAANEMAGKTIGYSIEELKGKPFRELLPSKIAEALDDYVEFEAGANDVGEVLKKVRDFQMITRGGQPLPFRLKIVRHHSQEHDEFMLIMQDESKMQETSALMAMLREHFKGHAAVNPDTNLADRATLHKCLEMVTYHLDNLRLGACLAIVQLDDFESILGKYGIAACHKVIQNVAGLCQQNLRGNDIVTQIDRNRLGVILVGTGKDPAKIVLNRLRWLIASMQSRLVQGVDVQTTATIVLSAVNKNLKPEEQVAAVEKILAEKPASSINLVVEI